MITMYTLMYNYKGNWILTSSVDIIPPHFEGMTIDLHDIHYEVSRIVFQPEQKRYKIFLEKI